MAIDTFNYTVQDAWGTRTATVTVTVEGIGVGFVNASGDAASTLVGQSVVIDVLADDQFSPGLGPLQVAPGSVTAPSPSGTATIVGDQIRYTPASGFTGTAAFNYDAQSSVDPTKRSTATVSVQVSASVPTGSFRDAPLVGGSTWMVPEVGSFAECYNNAKDGDHISIADGQVYGSVTLGRTFANANPIVIKGRSRGPNTAAFSGAVNVNGAGHWLYQLRFTPNILASGSNPSTGAINVRANYVYVTRCLVTSPNGIICFNEPLHHLAFNWISFTGSTSAFSNQLYFRIPNPWTSQSQGHNNVQVYSCYFRDTANNVAENAHMYFGNSGTEGDGIGVYENFTVERCLIDGPTGRKRGFYMKTGCTRFAFNQDNRTHGNGGFRQQRSNGALHSAIIGCRIGGSDFIINDKDVTVTGGHYRHLELHAGTHTPSGSQPNKHNAADNCTVSGVTGTIEVGHFDSATGRVLATQYGAAVDHVTIYNGNGANVDVVAKGTDESTLRIFNNNGPDPIPPTVNLTAGMVGWTGSL